MALMPGAEWRPMPGSSTTRISSYDILCLHTMVGSLAGTDAYFRATAAGTNSHFGVGADGTIYQWVDTAYRSGANLNGNYHIISVETADTGAPFAAWSGSDVPAWTDAQITANARIAAWVHDTHGIPLAAIPDSIPGHRGIGWHRLGVPGYMAAGAEQWSSSTGKVCPGDRRIAQIPQVIALAQSGATPVPEAPDMTDDQAKALTEILGNSRSTNAVVNDLNVVVRDPSAGMAVQLAKLSGVVAGLAVAVGQLQGGKGLDQGALNAAAQAGAQQALSDLGNKLTS